MISRPNRLQRHSVRAAGLLAACLVAAVTGCGGGSSPEQMQAIRKLQDLGGKVNFKKGGYEVDLTNTAAADADMAQLKHIAKLKNLSITGTAVGDAGLEQLHSIQSLEYIALARTRATPEGIAALRKSLPNAEVKE